MAVTSTRPLSKPEFALRKLWWIGPLTFIVAVLVNLLLRITAVATFGIPDAFMPLQPPIRPDKNFPVPRRVVWQKQPA